MIVEQWQINMKFFYTFFREMTITLHNLWHILGLPIEGEMATTWGDGDVVHSVEMEMMLILKMNKNNLLDAH